MKTKTFLRMGATLLLILLCGFQLAENPGFLGKLKASLDKYNNAFPEEKIYLTFDKPFYKPGEDIWFNVVVLNSNTHKPTNVSEVVYVELADPRGNMVSRLELVVNDGTARGDFRIAAHDAGGIYQVSAHTSWMKNFSKEPVFRKEIQVQRVITPRLLLKLDFEKEAYGPGDNVSATLTARNLKNELIANAEVNYTVLLEGRKVESGRATTDPKGILTLPFVLPGKLSSADGLLQLLVTDNGTQESITRSIPITLNKIALTFYPEGGTFVEGVPARIGIKALNEFNKAADVTGIIVDQNQKTVTSFSTFHMGMGAFQFTPEAGRHYFAKIITPQGSGDLIPLPLAQPDGYTMRVTGRNDGEVELSVYSPVATKLLLAGQAHGNLYHTSEVDVVKGVNTIAVNTTKFPSGIAVFTLFRQSGTGLCERLLYLNHDRQLNITLTPDKDRYIPGEKVRLRIETKDDSGKPTPAKLALAVADDQLITFADDKQDNLLSAMMLSTEVKGTIQEPAFYFDPKEPKAKEALDYLLMTQGWRRFRWEDITEPRIELMYDAERVKSLSGVVTDRNGKPVSDEVTLVELGNLKRIIKVKTGETGYFSFRNTDPSVPVMLLTGKHSQFVVDYNPTDLQQHRRRDKIQKQEDQVRLQAPEVAPVVEEEVNEDIAIAGEATLDVDLNEDVASLSEVVVVGYGVEAKRALTSSVTIVQENSLTNLAPMPTVENHLQGRVAGVAIQPRSANPGAAAQIRIRGVSSLAGGSAEPLYVIDGHPIGNSLNYNFSNSSILATDDIQSIQIYHSPEATALFGSAAINGAIVITTKSGLPGDFTQPAEPRKRFSSVVVQPRRFSATREFYTEQPNKGTRSDFRTTVYWNAEVITNEKGIANVTFENTDAVSAFRITAEGFTGSGLIGRSEHVYSTLLPVSVDAKVPAYLGFEDVLSLPVRVTNETNSRLTARVKLNTTEGLIVDTPERTIELKPRQSAAVSFRITSAHVEGDFPLQIKIDAEGHTDEIRQQVRVKPVGFPMRASFSGKDTDRNVRFRITDAEEGTLRAELEAFPDVLTDLFTGAEGIFREPYGCFEQASSSTFPNILALQYLQRSGTIKPETQKKALEYIRRGYQRLTSYEVKGGGFEWFGHTPAHEALTAYGLIEFFEMKKVFNEVDGALIERTRNWLLSRKKGDGTFMLQSHGMDDFSRPSGDVSNAYITYALSETGTTDLTNEYEYNLRAAMTGNDMYLQALMANVAYNIGRKNDYNRFLHLLASKSQQGLDNLTASHSIVWSQGLSLTNETVALWALALMKDGAANLELTSKCIDFLISRRSGGMFGSTQATVLSLKALSEYALLARNAKHAGVIQVYVNQILASELSYPKGATGKIKIDGFADQFSKDGEQRLRILFNETPAPLPYSMNVYWHSKMPASNEKCKLRITTNLMQPEVRLNETVRLTAKITNSTAIGLPMTMAVIGIPAGLSAQPWQLKELQEKRVFDFYEITDGYLYVYYTSMQPRETKTLLLDLKAEIPGTFTASASSTYLYYTNEYKDWAKGNSITISN